MNLNLLFTTSLIMKPVISLVCCLKRQDNFLNCLIPAGHTIGISRDVTNYLFYFW